MAREYFEDRKLDGTFRVACKFENAPTRYWEANKKDVVKHIIDIVSDYRSQGYRLTLRQLHYQLVSNNWIVNHDTAYKKLGEILDDCRYAGLIDWNMIVDRGRQPKLTYWVMDKKHAMQDTIDHFRLDRQEGQKNVVELWTEKDALSEILERSTDKFHINLCVNKGYTSSSAAYVAFKRAEEAILQGKKFTILYFGDHDPSGLDMVRDIRDRLLFFLCRSESIQAGQINKWWDDNGYNLYDVIEHTGNDKLTKLMDDEEPNNRDKICRDFDIGKVDMYLKENELFNVIPIGLSMEQIKKYNLPANPTKLTDSRSEAYVKKFGRICWEVDALNPKTLTQIVEKNVREQIDMDLYKSMLEREAGEKDELIEILKNIDE